jgi:hypothetical protein
MDVMCDECQPKQEREIDEYFAAIGPKSGPVYRINPNLYGRWQEYNV